MKLKELLKHHNIQFPANATHAVQDGDREIKFASSSNVELDEGIWLRGDSVIHVAEVFDLPLASDWDTAIVAKQNWIQITREQIKSMEFDLQEALAGQPVVLRNGAKAFVRHFETDVETDFPLLGCMRVKFSYRTVGWTREGRNFSSSTLESDFDIVGMWIEPAVFNHWDALDPKWKFIAADEDGSICVFTTKPDKDETFWDTREGDYSYATDLFNFQYTDWEHSLVERPSEELL